MNNDEWPLTFISRNDFYTHVSNTIRQYGDKLKPYDIDDFNSNLIDPVKMVFDKAVYILGFPTYNGFKDYQ